MEMLRCLDCEAYIARGVRFLLVIDRRFYSVVGELGNLKLYFLSTPVYFYGRSSDHLSDHPCYNGDAQSVSHKLLVLPGCY